MVPALHTTQPLRAARLLRKNGAKLVFFSQITKFFPIFLFKFVFVAENLTRNVSVAFP